MKNLSDVRKTAWETRRAKYGKRGHAGSYSRGPAGKCRHCSAAVSLVMRLHNDGVLSEGQVAKALQLDRIEVRELADIEDSALSSPEQT